MEETPVLCFDFFLMFSCCVALGGLVVSVLATGPKVRGFDPIPEHHFLRMGSKAVGPMS
jgi:hypothetical protein